MQSSVASPVDRYAAKIIVESERVVLIGAWYLYPLQPVAYPMLGSSYPIAGARILLLYELKSGYTYIHTMKSLLKSP